MRQDNVPPSGRTLCVAADGLLRVCAPGSLCLETDTTGLATRQTTAALPRGPLNVLGCRQSAALQCL